MVGKIRRKTRKKQANAAPKAWIISVDMGYGHQRAAYALRDIAYERIITANTDTMISEKERKLWTRTRLIYDFFSKMREIPLIGKPIYAAYSQLYNIQPIFPYRDLSRPTYSVLEAKRYITKGLCKDLIEYTAKKDIPVLTTFFIPALAFHYAGKEVYCVVTDYDHHRVWVPDNPKECKITYFSPGKHASLRLLEYGVPEQQIVETGFPLPKENIGEHDEIVKKDLLARLVNLDPRGVFFGKYKGMIEDKLLDGKKLQLHALSRYKTHILTITFMVGGAGAQKDIGIQIATAFRRELTQGLIRLNLVAGTRIGVKNYFESELRKIGLEVSATKSVSILFALDKEHYFDAVNAALRATDILWTKPSEMSFYNALGIPIIIAPPIGDHENYNREWLINIGSGVDQKNPLLANEWITYLIDEGWLADSAMQGFIDAPRTGTYRIEEYLAQHSMLRPSRLAHRQSPLPAMHENIQSGQPSGDS